jgi:hypothetical protein
LVKYTLSNIPKFITVVLISHKLAISSKAPLAVVCIFSNKSLTAVCGHLKVKGQKDAKKAAEKAAMEVAAAALAQQAEAC